MAYFANGTEGGYFERECAKCRLSGDRWGRPCPVAEMQWFNNYDAVNNKVATRILDGLVKNDGLCVMLRRFPELLRITDDADGQQRGAG